MEKNNVNVWTYTTILILALFVGYILFNNPGNTSGISIDLEALETDGSQVVEIDGKAAVVYNHPTVDLEVVFDPECSEEDCPIDNIISTLEASVIGTRATKHEIGSNEGKKLVEKYGLEYTPSFMFSKSVEEYPEFEKMVKDMELVGDKYLLDAPKVLPITVNYFEEIPDVEGLDTEFQDVVKSIIRDGKFEITVPEGAATKGQGDIVVLEFSDYQCSFCQKFAVETYPLLLEEYGDDLEFHFADFVVPSHTRGVPAALAAECAGAQDKYFEMHDKLFSTNDWKETDNNDLFKGYASELGLNLEQFGSCVDNEELIENVRSDQDYGDELGVQATPTIYVNGYKVQGAYPFEVFKALIELE